MNNEEMEQMLIRVDEQTKSNTRRIGNLETEQAAVHELALSVKSLAQDQGHMKDDISEMKGDLKTIAMKPAKRWEAVVEKILLVVVGALIAALLSRIGL